MSNLGLYQSMVEWSKKVGGPKKFMGLLMIGGYAVGRSSEFIIKGAIKVTKKINRKGKHEIRIFEVTSDGKGNDGLEFVIGDKYKVLESDGESILIEKIGDTNNPYFVSADFLRSVSDFIL